MKANLFSILFGGLLVMSACAPANATAPGTTGAQSSIFPSMPFSSPDFAAGGAIPAKYTCSGNSISPALSWGEPPAGTGAFAVILTDPDAPSGAFIHWVIYNIPGTSRGLPEAISTDPKLADGSLQGYNGARRLGYTGPCPSSGNHHYVFKLYALDGALSLEAGETKDGLLSAMQEHILAQAELIGTYGK